MVEPKTKEKIYRTQIENYQNKKSNTEIYIVNRNN